MRFPLFRFSSASRSINRPLQILSTVLPSCYCLFASTGTALHRCCTCYSCGSIETISKTTSIIVSLVISRIVVASRYSNFNFFKSKVFYECLQKMVRPVVLALLVFESFSTPSLRSRPLSQDRWWETWLSLFSSRSKRFQRRKTSDSNLLLLNTYLIRLLEKLDFRRFLIDKWVSRLVDLRFELSMIDYSCLCGLRTMCVERNRSCFLIGSIYSAGCEPPWGTVQQLNISNVSIKRANSFLPWKRGVYSFFSY